MKNLTQMFAITTTLLISANSYAQTPPLVSPPKVYDLFNDFAGGPWKYGYFSSVTPLGAIGKEVSYSFALYAPVKTENGTTRAQINHERGEPHIAKCHRPNPCRIDNDVTYEWPNQRFLQFHPGPNGEYTVARWEAPETTKCYLDFQFKSLKSDGISVDVYVVHSAQILDGNGGKKVETKIKWGDMINGKVRSADSVVSPEKVGLERLIPIGVRAGDFIDFIVGYGPNKNYQGDIAGVRATITCLN